MSDVPVIWDIENGSLPADHLAENLLQQIRQAFLLIGIDNPLTLHAVVANVRRMKPQDGDFLNANPPATHFVETHPNIPEDEIPRQAVDAYINHTILAPMVAEREAALALGLVVHLIIVMVAGGKDYLGRLLALRALGSRILLIHPSDTARRLRNVGESCPLMTVLDNAPVSFQFQISW